MKPIIVESNGLEVKVVEVNKNKTFSCSGCSLYSTERCNIKKQLSLKIDSKVMTATEIVLVVTNMTNRPVHMPSRSWELMDSDGYSFGCTALCADHISPRCVNPDSWEINPGSQVKFSLAFPELEDKINPIILECNSTPDIRIILRKPTQKIEKLLAARDAFNSSKKQLYFQTKKD